MPEHRLDEAVQVLLQLPRQAALPDAGLADDRHQPRLSLACGGMELILEQPKLLIPPHERRLQRGRSPLTAATSDDCDGAPHAHGRFLPLELLGPHLLERDRARGRPLGGLANEDGARLGRGLEPRRGVDHVPGNHALGFRTDSHGRLAGQHPGPGAEALVATQGRDRRDELQRRANRALGIVLVRGRRAPHRHDRVADELLDHASMAVNCLARKVEIAGQQVPGVFGVALLGIRGEANQVDEQHGHEPAFRHRLERDRGRLSLTWGSLSLLLPHPRPPVSFRTRRRTSRRSGSRCRMPGRRRPGAVHIPRRTSGWGRSACCNWRRSARRGSLHRLGWAHTTMQHTADTDLRKVQGADAPKGRRRG